MIAVASSSYGRDHSLRTVSGGGFLSSIDCTDIIGVRRVVTTDTIKLLSHSIFRVLQSTRGACARGAFGVDEHQTNTVFRCQLFQPCSHLPIAPRSEQLAVPFSSITFSDLHAGQVFENESLCGLPRQTSADEIHVIFALSSCASFSQGTGLLAPNICANGFDLLTVKSSI